MSKKEVSCATHGKRAITFACQHIVRGEATRFIVADAATDDKPWPDACCEKCDARILAHPGEWDDALSTFVGVTVLCSGCYEAHRDALSEGTS